MASGALGLATARVGTEQDVPAHGHPWLGNALAALAFAERGVRPVVVRFAPTVHGPGDPGFLAALVGIARDKGASGYLGDGAARRPGVHRLDAANLVRLAVDAAPPGSTLFAAAAEGGPTRDIAEAIGRGLDLPVVAVPADRAVEHFGWMAASFGADSPTSSAATRRLLGWDPVHPGLLEDLDAGHYFKQ